MTITDPRRMLPGYTFALPSWLPCFVRGCSSEAVLSATHKLYGRVLACADHHPHRAALALPFGAAPGASVPVAPPDSHPKTGGAKVPRRPTKPVLPPTPVTLPTSTRPF
jgi:hypothetical protein